MYYVVYYNTYSLLSTLIELSEGMGLQKIKINKGDVLLQFSSVKWNLNEHHIAMRFRYVIQYFALVTFLLNKFFVAPAVFELIGIRFM